MKNVSIIGSGNVGTNTAFFVAEDRSASVVLVDVKDGVPTGKALDLMEAGPIRGYDTRILGTNDMQADRPERRGGARRRPGAPAGGEARRSLPGQRAGGARDLPGGPGVRARCPWW